MNKKVILVREWPGWIKGIPLGLQRLFKRFGASVLVSKLIGFDLSLMKKPAGS